MSYSSRREFGYKKLTGSARIFACISEIDPLIKEWRKIVLKKICNLSFSCNSYCELRSGTGRYSEKNAKEAKWPCF